MSKAKPRGVTEAESRARWMPIFIETLAETCSVTKSAEAAGVSTRTAHRWRKDDEAFGQAWDDALAVGADVLESEAVRRAHDGWDEPVYQQGKQVGIVRKFSDTLLIFLLKGAKPEKYKDRHELSGKVDAPNVVVYLPAKGGKGGPVKVEAPPEPAVAPKSGEVKPG